MRVNFRRNLGEMLNRVQHRNENIVIINEDGNPYSGAGRCCTVCAYSPDAGPLRRLESADRGSLCREVPAEDGLAKIDSVVARERGNPF